MVKFKFSKETNIVLIAFLAVSILFFILVYFPNAKKVRAIKKEYVLLQDELRSLSGANNDMSLAQFIISLKERVTSLRKRFPHSEEATIREVSRLASRCGLAISTIKSSFKGLNKEEQRLLGILGKNVKKGFLDIYATGTYIQAGKFLEEMREDFDIFTALERLSFEKKGTGTQQTIHIRVSFYLAS